MSSDAFGETLQFVTEVKLHELEKHHKDFRTYIGQVLKDARAAPGTIEKVDILAIGIDGWTGWTQGSSIRDNAENIREWIEEAKSDPGFSASVVQDWAEKLERQIEHEGTQFDYSRLFGNLLTEWLRSSSQAPTRKAESIPPDGDFEKLQSTETKAQTEQLQSIIYEDNNVDTASLQKYLEELFAEKEASQGLEKIRQRMKALGKDIGKHCVSEDDMKWCISSLLATDLLSARKQRTLKEFSNSSTILKELASVLDMQLGNLDSWCWPEEGVVVEPRRALNGKIRFFLDGEILTALLLQYIGVKWCMELKKALVELKLSSAWKKPESVLDNVELTRRRVFLNERRYGNIDQTREEWQAEYFMNQLPSVEQDSAKNAYNTDTDSDESVDETRPRFDTPVERKQSLLHLISTEILLDKTLSGQCTVVCTDLQWFGPSLSHATILTVLRFFGMREEDLSFMKAFLKCPLKFPDPTKPATNAEPARVRVRGTPISFALSAFCGEAVLSIMDFAVNQRADALFLYRLHDDFWFLDSKADKCVKAWKELERYTAVAGLTFNQEKTGCVQVGLGGKVPAGLPEGKIKWGMMCLDGPSGGKFILDQEQVDQHIEEMRRQLAATNSVFGWVQAYNAYGAFLVRNCGKPAHIFGRAHVDSVIATLVKVQRKLFPKENGNVFQHLAPVVATKFQTENIPIGWYLWPTAGGGLQLKDYVVDLLLVRKSLPEEPEKLFAKAIESDQDEYRERKKKFDESPPWRSEDDAKIVPRTEPFMPFDEYIKGRESCSSWWHQAYKELMERPSPVHARGTASIEGSIKAMGESISAFDGKSAQGWVSLSPYWKWIVAVHHDDLRKHYGGLDIVKPSSIPVGMVAVFKDSKTRWEH